MSDNNHAGSAGQAGSSAIAPVTNPNSLGGPAGQANSGQGADHKAMYEELEKKFGSQGRELGEYRSFIEGITPLLNKLDASPELVQAIIDGKVDSDLAKAAMEGKISIQDAQVVTQAHAEVKKDLGKKSYDASSPEDIQRMIEEKVNTVRTELEAKVTAQDDMRSFERSVNDFIDRTEDFSTYASEIDAWLDEHDTTDIQVAYYAVKGQVSEREAQKQAKEAAAEAAKDIALNAGGGSSNRTFVPQNSGLIDTLIAGRSNPNIF